MFFLLVGKTAEEISSRDYLVKLVQDILTMFRISEDWIALVRDVSMISLLVLVFLGAFFLVRFILTRVLRSIVKKTKAEWDDILLSKKFLSRLAYVVPASIVMKLLPYAIPYSPGWIVFIQTILQLYTILMVLLAVFALLSAFNDLYNNWEISRYKPIKGYLQLIKVILSFIAGILFLAIILGKSPVYFLTGLGAVSAVLMLVFKDALLGLVAGVQLSANDMVRPGDWISMPKYQADGDVLEISLTTVKVQNFDRTIVYIPAYTMISDSFTNWRGMYEANERRIKRALYIDMNSVGFCSDELLEKLQNITLIKDYILSKQQEITEYNKQLPADTNVPVNGRRQTNLGVFRAYMEAYLRSLHTINQNSIMMVRQLPSSEKGLPLEVYAFAANNEWVKYEQIQSDIFDHFIAALRHFDLKLYQAPAGTDVLAFSEKMHHA